MAKLVKQFDETKYLKEVSENFDELGFSFGRATLLSSALGTMRSFQELPTEFRDATTRIILSSMRDGLWYSTFDTGQVILNTMQILGDEAQRYQAEANAGRKIHLLSKDGKTLSALEAIPGGYVGAVQNVGEIQNLVGARLDSVKAGERAYAQIEATVPYAAVKTRANGLIVSRRLLKITSNGTVELYPGEPIHLGDMVVSEMTLSREGDARYWGAPESSYVVAEDGIPAVGQGIEEDKTYLADAKLIETPDDYWAQVKDTQRFPDRTVRVLKVAPGGSIKLYQVWRAAFSGKAALPPAQAYDMYNSGVQGNSIAGEVVVS